MAALNDLGGSPKLVCMMFSQIADHVDTVSLTHTLYLGQLLAASLRLVTWAG